MDDDDRLIYLGFGPLAAIVLGVGLVPLRGVTIASNFALAFLALTIVVGELGGRVAAVATALVSALSLNFFLTEPYRRLTIHGKDDIIAFVGLALLGLLAAALGSPRRRRLAIRRQLGVLEGAATRGASRGPVEPRIQQVADATLAAFPLTAVAVRDMSNRLLARSGDRERTTATPALVTEAEELVAITTFTGLRKGEAPVSETGLRVPLVAGGRRLGWLDLWGEGRAASRDECRALVAVAAAVAMLIDVHNHSSEAMAAAFPPGDS